MISKTGIKLADFGLTASLRGEDGKGIFYRGAGTPKYWAPEIHKRKYHGKKVDIFSIGIVLFIIYGHTLPFGKASIDDIHFRMINSKKENHINYYWKQVEERIDHQNEIPVELKKLFMQIFS